MLKKVNHNIIFITCACLSGVVAATAFEFVVNLVFRQPVFFFSFDRFLAISISFSSLVCLIKYRRYFCENLHKAFLLISLAFGVSFILVFPRTVYLSPDDQIHFRNAYFFMNETMELSGGFSAISSSETTNMVDKGFDEMAAIYEVMNAANRNIVDSQYYINESPRLYSRIIYLPFYIGFQISNFLHLSFTTSVAVSKIFNLICYVILVYLAIKISGKFNKIFFVVGLLICNLFLATQFSYDPLTFASLILATSLFLHIMQSESASRKGLLCFILIATFGCLSKAVYCPIMLLALVIPNRKFDCKKRAIAFKICAVFVMLVLASTFILPMLGGSLGSDIRGGNTSVSGQINFLLNNPLKAVAVVAIYLTGQLPSLVLSPYAITSSIGASPSSGLIYSLCTPVIPLVETISLLTILWITLKTSLNKDFFTTHFKVSIALIYLTLVGATTASMYLSFTEVGSLYVSGVQPRYFMPFMPLLLLLLVPTKSMRAVKEKAHNNNIIILASYSCLALILVTYILQLSRL